jgi:hypothetical protein
MLESQAAYKLLAGVQALGEASSFSIINGAISGLFDTILEFGPGHILVSDLNQCYRHPYRRLLVRASFQILRDYRRWVQTEQCGLIYLYTPIRICVALFGQLRCQLR